MNERTVEDFFDNELLDYANYTLQHRAIPSLVDGFKPSQRKIAHTANEIWRSGNEKPMKVFQLGGLAASKTYYHHGSLDGTIIGMVQKFKNSMSIFEGIGQFGSLRSPEAGAPRYVGVKFNDNFRLLYKDFEIVEHLEEEGDQIEPKFFLPIIPTVLLNGGSGIAVGFATNILNRNPLSLIEACFKVLKGKECPQINPWIAGFGGTFKRVPDAPKSWTIHGKYEIKNTSTVEVTEIPPSLTYEKYEEHLESMIQKGLITSYEDHSAEFPKYVLKFKRASLEMLQNNGKLDDALKMQERVGENYTTLDEFGKLKIFQSPEEIVKYFVKLRLGYYELRKIRALEKLRHDQKISGNKLRFIEEIIAGTLLINNRSKKDIEVELEEKLYDKVNEEYNYLLSMPIHSLTIERACDLRDLCKKKQEEIIDLEAKTPDILYETDLKELYKKVKTQYAA